MRGFAGQLFCIWSTESLVVLTNASCLAPSPVNHDMMHYDARTFLAGVWGVLASRTQGVPIERLSKGGDTGTNKQNVGATESR